MGLFENLRGKRGLFSMGGENKKQQKGDPPPPHQNRGVKKDHHGMGGPASIYPEKKEGTIRQGALSP